MPAQVIHDPRLTKRWNRLGYHEEQSNCYRSPARFNINHSGRRSGKTELQGKRKVVKKALKGATIFPDWRCFIGAPVRHQAKKIYWSDVKQLVPKKFMLGQPNESELIVRLINGSEIHVVGMDRPERVEGQPWDHGVLDEYGNMKPQTWEEHVRPALSDRKGTCDFIGVPEGRNHYYDLVQLAKEDKTGAWRVWHWPSWEILDAEEIEAAQRDMDPLIYEQEYGGEFVNFTGMAYYVFDETRHVGKYRRFYDPKRPLVFCFDFNVSPGVAVICQEMGGDVFDLPIGMTITAIIGEVYIPRQSNTIRVCKKLIEDWGPDGEDHQGLIICYGDSTGGAEGTAKISGNDWDLIKQQLYPHFGDRLYFKVPTKNPKERQRVNAVNSRLMTYSGDVRMVMDGKHCKKTIRDFEGVRVIEGTAGEIDKKSDPLLTHLTDAVGYYVHKEFPVQKYYTADDIRDMMARRNKERIDTALRRAA